jgi:hypothetical protein
MTQLAESPVEFTKRANNLLQVAKLLSAKQGGDALAALNRCLSHAKSQKMTWVEGLEYAVQALK